MRLLPLVSNRASSSERILILDCESGIEHPGFCSVGFGLRGAMSWSSQKRLSPGIGWDFVCASARRAECDCVWQSSSTNPRHRSRGRKRVSSGLRQIQGRLYRSAVGRRVTAAPMLIKRRYSKYRQFQIESATGRERPERGSKRSSYARR